MTPEREAQRAQFKGDPKGEPLAIVLYRLEQIERRMDRLLTAELYEARHEAIKSRVRDLEVKQDESERSMRQLIVGSITAVAGAALVGGITFL